MTIDEKVKLVKEDLLSRFPDCPHTVKILLWDDGTDLVECRYGTEDTIYKSVYYDNKLTQEEEPNNMFSIMAEDEKGNELLFEIKETKKRK